MFVVPTGSGVNNKRGSQVLSPPDVSQARRGRSALRGNVSNRGAKRGGSRSGSRARRGRGNSYSKESNDFQVRINFDDQLSQSEDAHVSNHMDLDTSQIFDVVLGSQNKD